MSKIPISLIIDDAGPVNMFHFHQPNVPHPVKVPLDFLKSFVNCCRKNKLKGKFSVVPIPGGLGRLDQSVVGFTRTELDRFIKVIKDDIEPFFSITPEILTHFLAYDIKKEGYLLHVCEDKYISTMSAEDISEYVSFGLKILCNIGLNPTGVTSPWVTGEDNEENYAKGIGMAFKKTLKRNVCFYFLHSRPRLDHPVVMVDTPQTGRVVSIPAMCRDICWCTQLPNGKMQAYAELRDGVNSLLSPNGKTGVVRELVDQGLPVILIAHWQSLFSDGRNIGLEGLDAITHRINHIFRDELEWMSFEEIAQNTK